VHGSGMKRGASEAITNIQAFWDIKQLVDCLAHLVDRFVYWLHFFGFHFWSFAYLHFVM
jgi:hypothetical protein